MASSAFLAGMRAFRRGEPLDVADCYESRRGWRHAQLSARSPSPDLKDAPTMAPVKSGARQ